MNILHLTAHLGGGVGKAHAALAGAMPLPFRQTYLLFEEPRDRRYIAAIEKAGKHVKVARDLAEVAARVEQTDIVQFEFWNHPKLFECLARTEFPPMRSVFWSHVSGLYKPVIQPEFLTAADRFVFTTPASLEIPAVRALGAEARKRLGVIGSAFGFYAPTAGTEPVPTADPIVYLGTVDFIKMNPGFFDVVDALAGEDVRATVWGAYDPCGDVVQKARAMRHPERVRLMGQTADPQTALAGARIFFYPLQPEHYGTAENVLVEAMSLGLVPVVLANPAEIAIVSQGETGFICDSLEDARQTIEMLLASPERIAKVGENARLTASRAFTPYRAARQFTALWSALAEEEKHHHDFRAITGQTPCDWYRNTQFGPGETLVEEDAPAQIGQAKGTKAHFQAAFPDDPCWQE
jgi:glycosyltransferase involved in cell wall biosynthesis